MHAPCGAEGTASRRNPCGRDPGHDQEAGWPGPDGRGRIRGRGSASYLDAEFAAAGAEIAAGAAAVLADAGIVFAVQTPGPEERALIPRGALLVCIAGAFADPDLVPSLAAAGIDAAAMELLPRITRAQSMDVLSSQANLAGYRAVIEVAGAFQRGFPMMMTAAGTVPPARVFVVGAGVAGLQAIATARRLGAIVSPPTSAPPPRRRSSRLAPPSWGSRTRKPPARPAPTPAK